MSDSSHWFATPNEVEAMPEPSGWTRSAAAVTEVLFVRGGQPPEPERVRWTAARLRDFCDRVGGKAVFGFRLALFAVTWIAPLVSLKFPTLGRHDLATRAHIIERFERTPFGMSIFAVKAFLCMHYFEHPDVVADVRFTSEEVDDR